MDCLYYLNIYPEMYDPTILDDKYMTIYQMSIDMAEWVYAVGCFDISLAISSLSHFSANTCKCHLTLNLHFTSYLKKSHNERIVMNSNPICIGKELLQPTFHSDFWMITRM